MSFLKSNTTFTRYKVIDDFPSTLWAELPDKLRKFSFNDINDTEDSNYGWVSFEDWLDTDWNQIPPQKGSDYLTFSLRVDTLKVPPALIKKKLDLAMKAEELKIKSEGKTFVSRERKKELKELVVFLLKKNSSPLPAEFQVIWNVTTRAVYIASVQTKLLELFEEYFMRSFDLHLQQLSSYGLAASFLPETEQEQLDKLESTNFRM